MERLVTRGMVITRRIDAAALGATARRSRPDPTLEQILHCERAIEGLRARIVDARVALEEHTERAAHHTTQATQARVILELREEILRETVTALEALRGGA